MSDAAVDVKSERTVAGHYVPMASPTEREAGLKSSLVRLLTIGIGFGLCVMLLGAAMMAVFGAPENRPSLSVTTEWAPLKASPAHDGGSPGIVIQASTDGGPLKTFAGIAPVAYLVQRIGGPYVRVEVLVQAGKDPHIFQPTPRQVIALSQARLFFRVGMPFEDRLLDHVAGGSAQFTVVDTAAGIAHRASSDEDDDEGQADPHVWLSPLLLKTMAANVAAALDRADPRHETVYQANLKLLDAELDALHLRIARSLSPYRGQAFYVFHPAFGYFADAYGLRQESVEVEGKLPTPRQVFNLINMARNDHVKIIFLQPQFNQQIAASIAQAIGSAATPGAVKPMDDLAFDVLANLDDVARMIAASNRKKME